MRILQQWWSNDLPKNVKFVFLALLANGLPAFIILMSVPDMTEKFFVWTINPVINARLVGVMYSNALLLVGIGAFQTKWPKVRIIMVVITLFSIFATILTFFFLKPFLAHPWYHLAFWLAMYFILFFSAPYVFLFHESKGSGLPVDIPLSLAAKSVAGGSMLISLVSGLGLIFRVDIVNKFWPWALPPLVGGLIGVLLTTHAAAYAWALWDGDWVRVRPMFWQATPTALLFLLLPLLHSADLRPNSGAALILYISVAGVVGLASLGIILSYRRAERVGIEP